MPFAFLIHSEGVMWCGGFSPRCLKCDLPPHKVASQLAIEVTMYEKEERGPGFFYGCGECDELMVAEPEEGVDV